MYLMRLQGNIRGQIASLKALKFP